MKTFAVFCTLFALSAAQCAEGDQPLTASTYMISHDKQIEGNVTFTQHRCDDPTYIRVYFRGLSPGLHGIHIHQNGDVSEKCLNVGDHLNPYNLYHGGPTDEIRHVGDLGNVLADESGIVDTTIVDYLVALSGERSAVGRSVVIHTGEDDLGRGGHPLSRKNGNAGARAACGVIGLL